MVPPSDAHGRTASLNLSVSPQVSRIASMIIQLEKLPFKTVQDLARWCLQYGITELSKRAANEEITAETRKLQGFTRLVSKHMEELQYQVVLDKIGAGCKTLIAGGHFGKALEIAERAWKDCDTIDDPYWRKMYRSEAKKLLDFVRLRERASKNGHGGSGGGDRSSDE